MFFLDFGAKGPPNWRTWELFLVTFGGFPEKVRIERSLQRELNFAGPRVIQNLIVCYFLNVYLEMPLRRSLFRIFFNFGSDWASDLEPQRDPRTG